MKEEEIKELFEQFEAIANEYEGVECWSAKNLQKQRNVSLVYYMKEVWTAKALPSFAPWATRLRLPILYPHQKKACGFL